MPRPKRTRETSRLTLDLALPVRDQLNQLKARTQADSLVEVVRRALAVYAFLHDERDRGRVHVVRGADGSGEREVVLL